LSACKRGITIYIRLQAEQACLIYDLAWNVQDQSQSSLWSRNLKTETENLRKRGHGPMTGPAPAGTQVRACKGRLVSAFEDLQLKVSFFNGVSKVTSGTS